jgi:hypothetical protein
MGEWLLRLSLLNDARTAVTIDSRSVSYRIEEGSVREPMRYCFDKFSTLIIGLIQ